LIKSPLIFEEIHRLMLKILVSYEPATSPSLVTVTVSSKAKRTFFGDESQVFNTEDQVVGNQYYLIEY